MPKLSSTASVVDLEILKRVASEKQREAKIDPEKPPVPRLKVKTVEPQVGERLFSEVFWKPKSIPDIPVRMFSPDDWAMEAQIMIPDANPHWQWPQETTELFAMAMYCDDTLLLHGLQGTGKSDLCKEWCATVGMPMWRMSCHEETRETHFLGSPSVTYDDQGNMHIQQEPTLLTDSLKFGGMFVEDEAFRHNSALVLQSLREKNTRTLLLPDAPGRDKEERLLAAHPLKWRYVLTDNTQGTGDTTGIFQAQVQDASTLDRITASIEVEYLSPAQEAKVLESAFPGILKPLRDDMCKFAKLVRDAFKEGDLQATMSVRGLLSWGEKIEILGSVRHSLRLSWFSKLSPDNQAKVIDIYRQVFDEKL